MINCLSVSDLNTENLWFLKFYDFWEICLSLYAYIEWYRIIATKGEEVVKWENYSCKDNQIVFCVYTKSNIYSAHKGVILFIS